MGIQNTSSMWVIIQEYKILHNREMHMGVAFINKKTKREIHRFLIVVGVPLFYAHRYGHSRGQHCMVQL